MLPGEMLLTMLARSGIIGSLRRFTRLTNAFSKKVENLAHAVSLHYMHYNFARVHRTLGTTPAVAAGVADHVWSLKEIVSLIR